MLLAFRTWYNIWCAILQTLQDTVACHALFAYPQFPQLRADKRRDSSSGRSTSLAVQKPRPYTNSPQVCRYTRDTNAQSAPLSSHRSHNFQASKSRIITTSACRRARKQGPRILKQPHNTRLVAYVVLARTKLCPKLKIS